VESNFDSATCTANLSKNIRFGTKADVKAFNVDVGFTLESGHWSH
jgi:hypothetical protein